MKLLTVVIPCFNSAAYMEKCIQSVLSGGEEVEIIIVNDGSTKDHTAQIADHYATKYPSIIKAIHKENGGHGSAVNAGMQEAKGIYFKVVDSDDWVDESGLRKVLSLLKEIEKKNESIDMLVSNFIYDKQGSAKKRMMSYENVLPKDQYFTWEDVGTFRLDQYIMMHSIIYRREILRTCRLTLPHHMFYVDNIYVYFPLPYVKKMYYLDVNLYHYFIGREDQSVNEKVMISRIHQQVKINQMLFDRYDLNNQIETIRLKQYMYRYLELITVVSSVLLLKEGSSEKLEMKKQLWEYMKTSNKQMYKKLRYKTILGYIMHLPGTVGRKIVIDIYYTMQRKIGFN
jgi:glycosyltransferase involved in cell wall biosynthesis